MADARKGAILSDGAWPRPYDGTVAGPSGSQERVRLRRGLLRPDQELPLEGRQDLRNVAHRLRRRRHRGDPHPLSMDAFPGRLLPYGALKPSYPTLIMHSRNADRRKGFTLIE